MKILVTNGGKHYVNWLEKVELVNTISESDLVVFTGGTDVNPDVYKEKRIHPLTNINFGRDASDIYLFNKAIKLNKPIIGICRGSQFITAMCGGKLIQHVNNHALSDGHEIKTNTGEAFFVTSTHHQMMYPFDLKIHYELIAWANPNLSDVYFKNDVNVFDKVPFEPEIVYYNAINALAVQWHPEMMNKEEPAIKYLQNLVNEKLFNNEVSNS